jgi:hypothetical protein
MQVHVDHVTSNMMAVSRFTAQIYGENAEYSLLQCTTGTHGATAWRLANA